MRIILTLLLVGALLWVAGCTTVSRDDRVLIHCPACGTELDALFHKSF
jgi:hypothetical protein